MGTLGVREPQQMIFYGSRKCHLPGKTGGAGGDRTHDLTDYEGLPGSSSPDLYQHPQQQPGSHEPPRPHRSTAFRATNRTTGIVAGRLRVSSPLDCYPIGSPPRSSTTESRRLIGSGDGDRICAPAVSHEYALAGRRGEERVPNSVGDLAFL